MSNARRRLARIGSTIAVTIAVGLLPGPPPAKATSPSTTTTSTTATTVALTSTSTGPTAPSPAVPDCNDVLAGGEQGSLNKTRVGGNPQLGFDLWRIQTDRPVGVYHVVDCIRAPQAGPPFKPAVITTVDLGEVRVSGTATFRVTIPQSAEPGQEVCDRFVLSGRVGGVPFTDISNQVCTIYNSCLFIGPGPCPPELPTTGPVASTLPPRGTLPFTGSAAWPLLITAVVLLGLGVGSLMVARRGLDQPTR
jgi:hypothetical protein